MSKIPVLAVVGPTASGKTKLAVELAKRYNGEIVSADSMQIYKDMQVATAKPTVEEMSGIKHHLMDFLPPDKSYSVGQYVVDAQKVITEINNKNKLPIICGGTGLYVDSLLNGIDFTENSSNDDVRSELNELADAKGIDFLLDMLSEFDKDSYNRLAVEKNRKRIIRAIEFYKVTGKTITQQNIESLQKESAYNSLFIGLTANDRQFLYDRINHRVDIMIENGLVKEAEEVINSKLSETSCKAIGYKELLPFFKGVASLEECIEKLKMETRRYAKRQLTWFRRNKSINWINIDDFNSFEEILSCAVELIENKGFLYG
ncbi:MAG: tRNA (adenosine(37)-N6)-dimethylallyltransferase MiaA [Ruminococcus sp.]